MRKKQRTRLVGKGAGAGTVLLCVIGAGGAARAQSVLTPAPAGYSATPIAVQEMQEQGMGYVGKGGNTPVIPSPADFLTWGPAVIRPHFTYQVTYATDLQALPGQKESSLVQSFSPGALVAIGTHLTIDYTPTMTFYSQTNFKDTVDHSIAVNYGNAYGDWTMGVGQTASFSSDPTIETGTQTTTEGYNTSLTASYAINTYLSVDFGGTLAILNAAGTDTNGVPLNDSTSWNTMEWLNYQVWPRLNLSVGAGVGYDQVSSGPNMSHENLQGRISWRATDKLSISVQGGAEQRQYIHSGQPDTIDPLYGASIAYQPFDNTSLSLSLNRATSVSLFQDQVTDNTSLGVSLTQRLIGKVSFSSSFSYNLVEYKADSLRVDNMHHLVVVNVHQSDTTYSANARLSWAFWTRASASIFYTYTQNSSSDSTLAFASEQAGFELDYHF